MKFVEHKLATGAMLTGYLRDETTEMPSYNTRPAVLILPGGGYRYCSPREERTLLPSSFCRPATMCSP